MYIAESSHHIFQPFLVIKETFKTLEIKAQSQRSRLLTEKQKDNPVSLYSVIIIRLCIFPLPVVLRMIPQRQFMPVFKLLRKEALRQSVFLGGRKCLYRVFSVLFFKPSILSFLVQVPLPWTLHI